MDGEMLGGGWKLKGNLRGTPALNWEIGIGKITSLLLYRLAASLFLPLAYTVPMGSDQRLEVQLYGFRPVQRDLR